MMARDFCDGWKEALKGIDAEDETVRRIAEANFDAFKQQQYTLFEHPAVWKAEIKYLESKNKRHACEDELLSMLLAMREEPADTV